MHKSTNKDDVEIEINVTFSHQVDLDIIERLNIDCETSDIIYKRLYKHIEESIKKFVKEFISQHQQIDVEKIANKIIDIVYIDDDSLYKVAEILSFVSKRDKCRARFYVNKLSAQSLSEIVFKLSELCQKGYIISGCDSVKEAIETFYSHS